MHLEVEFGRKRARFKTDRLESDVKPTEWTSRFVNPETLDRQLRDQFGDKLQPVTCSRQEWLERQRGRMLGLLINKTPRSQV